MINEFIENVLDIHDYKIKKYNLWQDNKTYEITLKFWKKIVIQDLLVLKSDKNQVFIEKVISFTNKNSSLVFADNFLEKRFFKYKWSLFQVMKKIEGDTITEKDINQKLVKATAKYLATFHNIIKDFHSEKYTEINYYRKMHQYRIELDKIVEKEKYKEKNKKAIEIFSELREIAMPLNENRYLSKWVIHGDPCFKNFLIDKDKKITGLIDYDMMSVSAYLWDLVDMIRGYMKSDNFQKKEFESLIKAYDKVRLLSDLEIKELENYYKMITVELWFRYLLNYFESKDYIILSLNREDSLKRATRCLEEIEKMKGFL